MEKHGNTKGETTKRSEKIGKIKKENRKACRNVQIDIDEHGLDWAEKWVKKWGDNWKLY